MQRWVLVVIAACGATEAPPAKPTTALPPVVAPVVDPSPVVAASDPAPIDAGAAPIDAAAPPNARPVFEVLHALAGIDVVESETRVWHIHGGAPAKVYVASINVVVKDARAHTIRATGLELLRGHCRTTTWDSRTALAITGYTLHDWDSADPIATGATKITLPATSDLYSVGIEFQGVSAYQACDRFAFAVQLVIDGTKVSLEVPLQVTRRDPLRQP